MDERTRSPVFKEPLALIATVIGLLALVTSIWQGCESRKAARVASWPYLMYMWNVIENRPQGLILENRGTGPAIVRRLHVYLDKQEINAPPQTVWYELAKRTTKWKMRTDSQWLVPGTALPVGSRLTLFGLDEDQLDNPTADSVTEFFTRGGVAICYCSLYGDCTWVRTGVLPTKFWYCSDDFST